MAFGCGEEKGLAWLGAWLGFGDHLLLGDRASALWSGWAKFVTRAGVGGGLSEHSAPVAVRACLRRGVLRARAGGADVGHGAGQQEGCLLLLCLGLGSGELVRVGAVLRAGRGEVGGR